MNTSNRIYRKKTKQYNIKCKNCGKNGHSLKMCKDPIISWGVILVRMTGLKNIIIKHKKNTKISGYKNISLIDDNMDNDMDDDMDNEKTLNLRNNIKMTYHLMNNIKFLMISRKHSLGYIEFIMGRYHISNIDNVVFIIQQMSMIEINKIKSHIDDFEFLWTDLWGKENSNKKYIRDYNRAKKLFEELKSVESSIDLKYLLDNLTPLPIFKNPEYGFPKGRKNIGETDLECAKREFMEETGLEEEDFKIIENVKPIVENIVGTNGVKYRHVYYLAESTNEKMPVLNDSKEQKYEIGSIGFYSYNDAKLFIRSYHIEKLDIVNNLVFYYLNKLMTSDE
jgi:8-oxo-dGTP pyrophosphatase MutT (NUDIX family)